MMQPAKRKRLVLCTFAAGDGVFSSMHFFMAVYATGRIEYYGHMRLPYSNRPLGRDGTRQVPYRALNNPGGYGLVPNGKAWEKTKAKVARKIATRKAYNPPVLTGIQPRKRGTRN